jgi:mannose-6-phosphate isomerase-like protein (cupin superfamily)
MLIRRLQDRDIFNALDNTIIREIFNPKHESQPLVLNYSLAHATLESNEKSLPHKFFEASEVYYILKGRGVIHIDDEIAEVSPGDTIYIPPQAVQWIENVGSDDLEFLCIVDPAWKPDAEELT